MRVLLRDKKFINLYLSIMSGALNDSMIRNAVVVSYTYFITVSWPTREDLVTLTVFSFVLPSLLFASYAGKIADSFDKIKVHSFKISETNIFSNP